MTLDETRPLCIISKHAYVLIRGSLFPSTFARVPLFRNYPYLLPALLKCSCPFPCPPAFFCLCSPVLQLKLTVFHCSQPCRMAWIHLTNITFYVQAGLSTLEAHVLSAIFSFSHEPHVQFNPEITSKMTRCSVRAT